MTWREKMDLLGKFFEKFGKRPSPTAKDKKEKILGRWLSKQLNNRAKNQKSMASAEIRDVWDAFKVAHIEYLRSYEETWYEKLEAVRLYFETNKKRPSVSAKDKKEKVLASWISTQLQNREKNKDIMASAEIRDVWDAFKVTHIEYLKSYKDIWYEKLEAATLFFETNKKRPSQIAKDKNKKTLAHWISTQLKNREKNQQAMASAEIRDSWDTVAKEYFNFDTPSCKSTKETKNLKKRNFLLFST